MRTLLAFLVCTAAIIILLFLADRSTILFECQLSTRHRLVIRQKSMLSNEIVLQITYHNPPAIGLYAVAEQTVIRPPKPLSFSTITDTESGVISVFDNDGVGFLLLYNPDKDDLWDSTGRSVGWNGSNVKEWKDLLAELITRNPTIPYSDLPGQPPS
ncbi:hypothetical protein SH449x_001404 [Pirellulaceae bacterium SH449]